MCGELVEARDRRNPITNPFTYPAWVLAIEGSKLQLAYLADGLTPEREDEAGAIAWVDATDARRASERECQRCQPALECVLAKYWPSSARQGDEALADVV